MSDRLPLQEPATESSEHTDVAALGAGVVAVAVSILVDDGPFDLSGCLVAAALTLVIYAYVWPHPRPERRKSCALAAVFASVTIPIYGFVLELFLAKEPFIRHFLAWPKNEETAVMPYWLAGFWILITAGLYWRDTARNPRRIIQGPADAEADPTS